MKNNFGEVIGVFQVQNKRPGRFTSFDEEILSILSSQASVAVENAWLYEVIKITFESFIETLAATIDARDPLTAGHSKRVTEYSLAIGNNLNLTPDETETLRYSALLHDYGKIGVSEAILTKKEKLSDEEYEKIKKHVEYTAKILEKIHFSKNFKEIPRIASSHHERIDGSGYSLGLSGSEIPLLSKIIAISDVFDAITSKRHYRRPMEMKDALKIIYEGKGNQFAEKVVEAFGKITLDKILEIMGKSILPQDKKALSKYKISKFYSLLKSKTPKASRIKKIFNSYY